jgi:hypothetical protein
MTKSSAFAGNDLCGGAACRRGILIKARPANFIRSPYISEKSCDCGGLRDTSWTTTQTTFSAPDPPALKCGVETLNMAAEKPFKFAQLTTALAVALANR